METPPLPPDLERLERLLAERERPEPSAELKARVIRNVETELRQANLPPKRPNGWWSFHQHRRDLDLPMDHYTAFV